MPLTRLVGALAAVALAACSSAPEPTAPAAAPAPAPAATAPAPAPDAPVVVPTVDLNTASDAALAAIPGVTPKMVHEFEEYRPYVSIAQYRKEIGKYTTQEQVLAWEAHLYVPIAYNDCDAATLAQWPGLDKNEAKGLLGKRPFADEAAFLAAVTPLVTAAELDAGRTLLP